MRQPLPMTATDELNIQPVTRKSTSVVSSGEIGDEPANFSAFSWGSLDNEFQIEDPEPIDRDEYDPVEEEFASVVANTALRLRELTKSISKKPQLEQKKAMKAFAEAVSAEWKPLRQKRTRDHQTILHVFAQERGPAGQKDPESMVYMAFVSYVLFTNVELLGRLDNESKSPFSAAIKAKNYNFIRACKMISAKDYRDRIRKELEVEVHCEDDGVETCLEMAVKKPGLPLEVRLELVRLAPKKAFERTNKRGCTPLHLAVAYDNFVKRPAEQAALVRELLNCGPDAMNVRTTSPKDLSVYQYQEWTRSGKARVPAKTQDREPPTRRGSLRVGGDQPTNADDARSAQADIQDREGASRGKGAKPEETVKAQGSTVRGTGTAKDGLRNKAVESVREQIQSQARAPPSPAGQQQPSLFEDPDQHYNEIREKLKLWYLRNKLPGEAVKFLSIRGQKRKSFWFDFGRGGYSITEDQFKAGFKHLEFDTSLSYVYFRQGEIKPVPKSSYVDKHLGGFQSMLFFFDWLRSRKVQRILSVIVEDDGPQVHSDEAIERAIGGFKVEILDWKKVDLDAGVLQRSGVGGNLREVHLQWSGNNSALRAWAGPDGLRAIPTLRDVYLYVRASLDSEKRREENLKVFKDRLEAPRENGLPTLKITVHDSVVATRHGGAAGRGPNGSERGASSSTPGGSRTVYSHHWIKCMDDFTKSFRFIEPPPVPRKPNTSPKLLKPVVVALLDDGVDLPHYDSAEHAFQGESFHTYEHGGKVWPWWNSAAGHGTLMARLIHRICPNALIYVIKLETQTAEGDSSKIHVVPESAIKAIHHAVEEKVDIISMSWTCAPPTPELRKKWEDAIDSAARNDILMFCSASDQGQFGERTFPHACRPNVTFRVGAALPTGKVFDRVADASTLDFALPGVEVFLEEDPVRQAALPDRLESHTGSSVATALAAGLAALVLEIVRIGVAHDMSTARSVDGTLTVAALAAVRRRDELRRVFLEGIGTSKDSAPNLDKFIVVDQVFGGYAKMLAVEGDEDQVKTVADMARQLMSVYRPRRDVSLSPLVL